MNFQELRDLKAGWYEGDERFPPPAPMAIMLAERVVALQPSFSAFPLLGGGVSLENETCEVEIHNDLHVSIFQGDDEVELETPSPEEVAAALKDL